MRDNVSESIRMHDPQAPYYKFRTPYLPVFFEELSRQLLLDKSTKLMDLCCDNGEIAVGMIDYVDQIFAVDGSERMLSLAKKHSDIKYFQADINIESFKLPDFVEHILIGRAIHWIQPAALNALVEGNLKKDGKVVICSTEWIGENTWYPVYLEIMSEYNKLTKRFGFDFTGNETLTQIGFKELNRFKLTRLVNFDLSYLINHSLSTRYGESLTEILKNLDRFSLDIRTKLSPFLKDKKLKSKVTSWAIIYEKL